MASNRFFTSLFQDGTAASPSITFQDVTTGWFRYAANQIAAACVGVTSVRISAGVLSILRFASNPALRLYRAHGTEGSPTATSDGANLGDVISYAHNGSAFTASAFMRFIQDGAASTAVPAKISFYGRAGTGTATEGLAVRNNGNVEIKKSATLGSASTDVLTCTGRLVLRQLANTTSKAGSLGEIIFCTGDSKVYVCTSASESAATWAALN